MADEAIQMHPCPLCKSNHLRIVRTHQNQGMDGYSEDWRIYCLHCRLVSVTLPADGFYGRAYFKTEDELIKKWNDLCLPYDDRSEESSRHSLKEVYNKVEMMGQALTGIMEIKDNVLNKMLEILHKLDEVYPNEDNS